MADRTVLITGASIAGLSTAFWLARAGWDVTVQERADAFRDGGQNVDVRGSAHEVIERMGIEQDVRAASTTEEGTRFVDERGRSVGAFPVGDAQDGPTAELEILRGDLARIILEHLPASVTVRFGDTVAAVADDDRLEVSFASGRTETYDLLIVAEGVRSATRDLVFGAEAVRRPLGLTIAYGTIPRSPRDDRWWRWLTAPDQRQVTLRPDGKGTTRATLATTAPDDRLAEMDPVEALDLLAERFAGAGWETDRVLAGLRTSDDVYIDALTQITMRSWFRGRVALVGDAAWCVTPLGGGGTALALTGGYVLAASLSHLDDTGSRSDRDGALARYDAWMRPLVTKTQSLPPGVPRLAYPRSRWGVAVLRSIVRVAATPPLRRILGRFAAVGDAGKPLPELREASSN
ncbi:MAG: FAD-dependent monooxygenase [Microbacterium arborescens]